MYQNVTGSHTMPYTIACSQCGAPIDFGLYDTLVTCVYCGTTHAVHEGRFLGGIEQHYMVLNSLNESYVYNKLLQYFSLLEYAIKDMNFITIESMQLSYIPVWLFSYDTAYTARSSYGGGKTYTSPQMRYNVAISARSEDITSREFANALKCVYPFARSFWGKGWIRRHMEEALEGGNIRTSPYELSPNIREFDIKRIESPNTIKYGQLSYEQAELHARSEIPVICRLNYIKTMGVEMASAFNRYNVNVSTDETILRHGIYFAQTVHIDNPIVSNPVSSQLVHYPVWEITYRYRPNYATALFEMQYHAVMDGATGDVIMIEYPVDPIKGRNYIFRRYHLPFAILGGSVGIVAGVCTGSLLGVLPLSAMSVCMIIPWFAAPAFIILYMWRVASRKERAYGLKKLNRLIRG